MSESEKSEVVSESVVMDSGAEKPSTKAKSAKSDKGGKPKAAKTAKPVQAKGGKPKAAKPNGGKPVAMNAAKLETAAPKFSPQPKPKIDPARLDEAAQIFDILRMPNRLQIIAMLAESKQNVGQIASVMDVSQPAVSHHLALMRHSGVVVATRDRKHVVYSLGDKGRKAYKVLVALLS